MEKNAINLKAENHTAAKNSAYEIFDVYYSPPEEEEYTEEENKALFQPKKRVRKPHLHKKNIAKEKVERGLEHETPSGKIKKAKVFEAQTICKCLKNMCPSKIDIQRQKEIFDAFYNSNWTQKTLFLRTMVKTTPVASRKFAMIPLVASTKRDKNCCYSFVDSDGISKDVCREFFLKCLQVPPSRVYAALRSKTKNPTGKDNRGRAPSKNKTKDEQRKWIKEFIDKIPKYESKTLGKYLSPELNGITLYREFKRMMELQQVKENEIPKENVFRSIFNMEYNLLIKKRHTDTCKTCDELNAQFNSSTATTEKKAQLAKEKENHLLLVKETNTSFYADIEAALKSEGKTSVLTFELQRTLETPSLSASTILFKRQLWTYNLCIFDEIEKKGYMYVWSENIASRGVQEVGSCLLKHLRNHISTEATEIILYSCGGQNRNIKLSLFLKKFLCENSTVETIEQKFFVSGHSYNSCNRSFSSIEKHKRLVGDVYTPADWLKVINESKTSNPKFHVTTMLPEDFFSSSALEKLIVNRQNDVEKEKINWNAFQEIQYLKNSLFYIIAKENDIYKNINIQNKSIGEATFRKIQMECLHPNGSEISQKKYEDLVELLQFIPEEHHKFYLNLKYSGDEADFGLASDIEDN